MEDLLLSDGNDPSTRIPVGRMGTPDDIGGICVFLASEAASYVNGATVWADGGGGF
jgi:NAD(P)-dependent dehydrogenase (short-subunit alcohol dehydrogenase family)